MTRSPPSFAKLVNLRFVRAIRANRQALWHCVQSPAPCRPPRHPPVQIGLEISVAMSFTLEPVSRAPGLADGYHLLVRDVRCVLRLRDGGAGA
jgi:hypothetical protein